MAAAHDGAGDRFVREALLALGSELGRLREAIRGVRDWDAVLADARKVSIGESVWSAVVLRGLAAEIPEPARSSLKAIHANATGCNAILLADAADIQARLRQEGIESVAVKGTALVAAHYPDIGARHVGDVGLLLREEDAPRAEEVLRGAGFRDAMEVLRYDGARREAGERIPLEEVQLESPSGVSVDIQDRIAGGAFDASDVEGVFARARTVEWQGRTLRIPSPADLVAGLCLHVFAHHPDVRPLVQRHLADLAVMVGGGVVGWDEVGERMSGSLSGDALGASRRLLEVGPPGDLETLRRSLRVRLANWRGTIRFVGRSPIGAVRVIFPARRYMAQRYGIHESSPVLPLYYLWRPVRGIWTLVSGR